MRQLCGVVFGEAFVSQNFRNWRPTWPSNDPVASFLINIALDTERVASVSSLRYILDK